MIKGVKITQLRQFFDERGKVMHMMRNDSPCFERFGEIYFSTVHPGKQKAWHLHTEQVLNYAVIYGQIKFVLYDDRQDSPTRGILQEIYLSPENYQLVTVPALIWNGFKGIGGETSIVANCATEPHKQEEIIRKSWNDPDIPYNWEIQHG
jgi:dTDP-4-dehydrorhamnose 3,5-epimerase